jgi:hypothetical protein
MAVKMKNPMEIQPIYENSLIYHLLVFLKAMEQYNQWGQKGIALDALRSDPQFLVGMRQLTQVMHTCGQRFLLLPEPPEDAVEADRFIRDLGRVLDLFTQCLGDLLVTADLEQRKDLYAALAKHTRAIKSDYHLFIEKYERAYPGHLSLAFQAIRGGMVPEKMENRTWEVL